MSLNTQTEKPIPPPLSPAKEFLADPDYQQFRSKLYETLAPYKLTSEQAPNVFDYARLNFANTADITIFQLDQLGLEKLKAISANYFYAAEFCNSTAIGVSLMGYDAVLVKKQPEPTIPDDHSRVSEEATVIHELAHASAKNTVLEKTVTPEGKIMFLPTVSGLERPPKAGSVTNPDEWEGMFLEEGFAQHHFGNYIDTYYRQQQLDTIHQTLDASFSFIDSNQKVIFPVQQVVEGEKRIVRKIPLEPDLIYCSSHTFAISPPSYAAQVYRDLCQSIPNFHQQVDQSRSQTGLFDAFYQNLNQALPNFADRFLHGRYFDPWGTNNSFKNIAFDYFNQPGRETNFSTSRKLQIN